MKSPTYFSYVDTSLRIIYLNIWSNFDDPSINFLKALNEEYKYAPRLKNKFKSQIIDQNFRKNSILQTLLLHEWHHYLQSIYYPYLYYLTFIEFKTIFNCQIQIQNFAKDLDFSDGKFLLLNKEVYTNLTYQLFRSRFYWDGNHTLNFTIENIKKYNILENEFCIIDLIENVTSIFQFNTAFGKDANWEDYWFWIRDPINKTYKNLYLFLSKEIGYEKAYKILPLLTQLSFHTTEPIQAFCILFNHLNLFYNEENLSQSFEGGLNLLEAIFPSGELDVQGNLFIEKSQIHFITRTNYEKIIEESFYFPLSIPAKKLLDLKNLNNTFETLLISVNESGNIEKLWDEFQPMAVVYNFLDFSVRENAVVYQFDVKTILGEKSENYLSEMTRLRDITLSLISPYNSELPHNCHHVDCEFYSLNLCRRWNAIPLTPDVCEFPYWFAKTFNKEILPAEQRLRHLITEADFEEIAMKESLIKRKLRQRLSWDYFIDKTGKYTLAILKEIVEKNDTDYFVSFTDMLHEKSPYSDLGASILLNFEDFLEDEREVFEIPEIINWFHKLKQNFPQLFYFLNLEEEKDKGIYIISFFVPHVVQHMNNKKFQITFEKERLPQFFKAEFYTFSKFCNHHSLDPVTYYKKVFKHIFI